MIQTCTVYQFTFGSTSKQFLENPHIMWVWDEKEARGAAYRLAMRWELVTMVPQLVVGAGSSQSNQSEPKSS